MSFKRKLKKAMKVLIGDVSDVKWKDLNHKKVYAAIAGLILIIVLIIGLIVTCFGGNKKETVPEKENTVEITEEVVDDNPLEVDAYEEINTLVENYFHGCSTGDIDLVDSTVDILPEDEIKTIQKKKDYVESYDNVICYTKKGLEEGSYVVFASFEMEIYNIETAAPGIIALYVRTGEDGGFYIYNGEASEELKAYVLGLAAEEEVAAIIAEVDTRYQQLIEEDEDLGKFAEEMLKAQQEEQKTEETAQPSEETGEPVTTTVTDTIRIREGRSTDAKVLDLLATGTTVKVYANYSDGWSKIEYNGQAGYCKTEYLQDTTGVPTASETEEPVQTPEEETPQEESTGTSVNKQMQFKESVRIRAERSTDSEKLATGYTRELVTVIENYSDGWSKVQYNGITGYCKTEFLTEVH